MYIYRHMYIMSWVTLHILILKLLTSPYRVTTLYINVTWWSCAYYSIA